MKVIYIIILLSLGSLAFSKEKINFNFPNLIELIEIFIKNNPSQKKIFYTQADEFKIKTIHWKNLNVRENGTSYGSILTTLTANDMVIVVGKRNENGFVPIFYKGKICYVYDGQKSLVRPQRKSYLNIHLPTGVSTQRPPSDDLPVLVKPSDINQKASLNQDELKTVIEQAVNSHTQDIKCDLDSQKLSQMPPSPCAQPIHFWGTNYYTKFLKVEKFSKGEIPLYDVNNR